MTLFSILFFVFGLIIGSFLNVVIFRLNTSKSLGGRSGCMSCLTKLSWYELVPVLSFIGLGGRCRTCKTRISLQYPLIEFASGLVFLSLFLKLQVLFFSNPLEFVPVYFFYAFVFSILLVIVAYDLRHKIIPDSLSLAFGIATLLGLFFLRDLNFYPHFPSILEFFSGPLVAAPFALLWLVSLGKWMGLGDAKLAIGIGWLLDLSGALSGIVWAFWIGALVSIFLVIFSKKYKMNSEIPFAPYLVIGTFLVFFFGFSLF